jgi:hypothetical protein
MSDPNFRDPRLDPAPLPDDDIRNQRLSELNQTNAMWGWIAGAVVLALVLVFAFSSGNNTTETASNVPSPPATTTGAPPTRPAGPPAVITPVPAPSEPSTTGQGSSNR